MVATCVYGDDLVAAVGRDHVWACQFHPEKSGRNGLRILENLLLRLEKPDMDLFPAIDLRNGKCVRLHQGDYGQETVYGDDPVAQALAFADAGAGWIHVVDLDAARTGVPENRDVVAAIAAAVPVPVQTGGGVRNWAAALALFDAGVERVVIGTAALADPDFVRDLAADHRVAVGLDAKAGEVATDGWLVGSGRSVLDVARRSPMRASTRSSSPTSPATEPWRAPTWWAFVRSWRRHRSTSSRPVVSAPLPTYVRSPKSMSEGVVLPV